MDAGTGAATGGKPMTRKQIEEKIKERDRLMNAVAHGDADLAKRPVNPKSVSKATLEKRKKQARKKRKNARRARKKGKK